MVEFVLVESLDVVCDGHLGPQAKSLELRIRPCNLSRSTYLTFVSLDKYIYGIRFG